MVRKFSPSFFYVKVIFIFSVKKDAPGAAFIAALPVVPGCRFTPPSQDVYVLAPAFEKNGKLCPVQLEFTDFVHEDANRDGVVNVQDIYFVQQSCTGTCLGFYGRKCPGTGACPRDIDQNEKIDADDVNAIEAVIGTLPGSSKEVGCGAVYLASSCGKEVVHVSFDGIHYLNTNGSNEARRGYISSSNIQQAARNSFPTSLQSQLESMEKRQASQEEMLRRQEQLIQRLLQKK